MFFCMRYLRPSSSSVQATFDHKELLWRSISSDADELPGPHSPHSPSSRQHSDDLDFDDVPPAAARAQGRVEAEWLVRYRALFEEFHTQRLSWLGIVMFVVLRMYLTGILVGLGVWIDRANSCDVEASGMLGLLLLLVVLMLLMRPYFDKVALACELLTLGCETALVAVLFGVSRADGAAVGVGAIYALAGVVIFANVGLEMQLLLHSRLKKAQVFLSSFLTRSASPDAELAIEQPLSGDNVVRPLTPGSARDTPPLPALEAIPAWESEHDRAERRIRSPGVVARTAWSDVADEASGAQPAWPGMAEEARRSADKPSTSGRQRSTRRPSLEGLERPPSLERLEDEEAVGPPHTPPLEPDSAELFSRRRGGTQPVSQRSTPEGLGTAPTQPSVRLEDPGMARTRLPKRKGKAKKEESKFEPLFIMDPD